MRKTLLALFCFFPFSLCSGESIDSLQKALESTAQDTTRLRLLGELVEAIQDEAVWNRYNEEALRLAEKLSDSPDPLIREKAKRGLGMAYNNAGMFHNLKGDIPLALEFLKKSLVIREAIGNESDISETLHNLGVLYFDFGEIGLAKDFLDKSFGISENLGDTFNAAITQSYLAQLHLKSTNYPEALRYFEKSLDVFERNHDALAVGKTLTDIGMVHYMLGDIAKAEFYVSRSNRILKEENDKTALALSEINLAKIKLETGYSSEALSHAQTARRLAVETGFLKELSQVEEILARIYESSGKSSEALSHYRNHILYRDSIKDEEVRRQAAFEKIRFEFENKEARIKVEQDKKNAEQEAAIERQRVQKNIFIAGFALVFLLSFIILRQYRLKNRANKKLTETLDYLEKTQAQLIHQEKMASLGMLTAGIAHEIQNPLNFVNNFAEASKEMLTDFSQAETEEERKEITSSLETLVEKIAQHGKRADNIIKSMLRHSHSQPEEKRPTNINKLCEEFVNHAYHGLRASSPGFTCDIEKNYQADLPQVQVYSQEITRVFLNLFTNAFQALKGKQEKDKSFNPAVILTTRQNGNHVEMILRDNGPGIPEDIRSSIFQPFFTTKPSGEGTGLGLSISYDIIKAHGGNIVVNSEPGSYTEFIVSLPL